MREFCTTLQAPGTTIVNLLLNERYTGERFWNLLHMTYVEVDGELYILGVQTNLDAYMPKNLKVAREEEARNKELNAIWAEGSASDDVSGGPLDYDTVMEARAEEIGEIRGSENSYGEWFVE